MKRQIQNLKKIYKMNKEDIDKNLEFVLYILLGFLGGLLSLIVVGLTAYAIGYKKLGRLIIGFIIGAFTYGILKTFVLYNLPFRTFVGLVFIVGIIAFVMAYIIHEDRLKKE
jgi:ABC-type multidrug transport system fused ATPase/permease subunit